MSTCPAPTQRPSPSQLLHSPGCLNLSIVQDNCLGSSNVFQTLFSFFTVVESSPHIVALQDIPFGGIVLLFFAIINVFFPLQLTAINPEWQLMFMKGYEL